MQPVPVPQALPVPLVLQALPDPPALPDPLEKPVLLDLPGKRAQPEKPVLLDLPDPPVLFRRQLQALFNLSLAQLVIAKPAPNIRPPMTSCIRMASLR